jgi:hypothetical protein
MQVFLWVLSDFNQNRNVSRNCSNKSKYEISWKSVYLDVLSQEQLQAAFVQFNYRDCTDDSCSGQLLCQGVWQLTWM